MPISFGTDGWRAIIAEDFTFDNVRACAQGLANYLNQAISSNQSVVIGYDTRFASEDFATVSAEVLAANGVKVLLCSKIAPTPVISYAVTATKATGGIVITASHNPGRWNGFKLKDSTGASASAELAAVVEKYTNEALLSGNIKRISVEEGVNKGTITYYDPLPAYNQQIRHLLDLKPICQNSFKIIVDSMFGAGIGYFRSFLEDSKLDIIDINAERNPSFPGIQQPEPIAKNLAKLASTVKEQKADVGLATDGDADRIGIMDEKGNFLNPHQVFALLALYFLEVRQERGPIVKSLCSTNMLELLGKVYDVPVYETKVGFKYVAPVMLEQNAFIGGEESGGYGFRGHVPERDGILAGLYFLDFMTQTRKTPSQLLEFLYSKVGPHYYDRYDLHILPEQRKTLLSKVEQSTISSIDGIKVAGVNKADGFKFLLSDESWLLIRFSGTEPLIRVYAESHSIEQVKKLLDYGKEMLGL
ncbi:phosphoglucomutase/phosphomannomutase family protein [Chloroflexota bacterium]